jgi:hypothetical protein
VKSIRDLKAFLMDEGIRSKRWTTKKGTAMGGGTLFCSMLANILRSQIYIGRIQN